MVPDPVAGCAAWISGLHTRSGTPSLCEAKPDPAFRPLPLVNRLTNQPINQSTIAPSSPPVLACLSPLPTGQLVNRSTCVFIQPSRPPVLASPSPVPDPDPNRLVASLAPSSPPVLDFCPLVLPRSPCPHPLNPSFRLFRLMGPWLASVLVHAKKALPLSSVSVGRLYRGGAGDARRFGGSSGRRGLGAYPVRSCPSGSPAPGAEA